MQDRLDTLEVVALQWSSHQRYQQNLDRLLVYMRENKNKHIIVVPEVFLTSFDYEHMVTAAKFSVKALSMIKKEANEQIVVLTLILKEEDQYVNQAVVIHKHKIVYRQNKVKLFKLGNEDLYFIPGKKKKIKLFEIEGVKYAILICFELRFKDLWGQIEGADVVLLPSKWGKPRKNHLEILSSALAVMNQCYVVVSNSSQSDMASSSSIISPKGDRILNDKLQEIEGKIDLREIKKARRYIVLD